MIILAHTELLVSSLPRCHPSPCNSHGSVLCTYLSEMELEKGVSGRSLAFVHRVREEEAVALK